MVKTKILDVNIVSGDSNFLNGCSILISGFRFSLVKGKNDEVGFFSNVSFFKEQRELRIPMSFRTGNKTCFFSIELNCTIGTEDAKNLITSEYFVKKILECMKEYCKKTHNNEYLYLIKYEYNNDEDFKFVYSKM